MTTSKCAARAGATALAVAVLAAAGRGCSARWNGPPPGRYGAGPGCSAGPSRIPARRSGSGANGSFHCASPRPAG